MTGICDGWLITPYSGHDLSRVDLAVGTQATWHAAFLDWVDGERVAKIRPPAGGGTVWLRVNGNVTEVGSVPGPAAPEPPQRRPSRLSRRT